MTPTEKTTPELGGKMRCVDLFAGWGGFTLGAENAGLDVVYAANHWPLAVEAHEINHPSAQHVCQDLRQADWTALPEYDLLLASPACQGHSRASQPKRRHFHDALRASAWAVVDCAEVTNPETVLVENVPDMTRWQLYPVWRQALELLGYTVTEGVFTASRFGVPQRRTRLVVCASRVGATVAEDRPDAIEPAFGPHIEWDAPGWRPIANASSNVQRRIGWAQERHGAQCLSQHVTGHKGISLDEPIRTVTTKDHWVLVDGANYRPLTIREYARSMSFPDTYAWPAKATRGDCIKGIGNAIPPAFATEMIKAVA